jgi:Fe2+ or Zn2+ uptake regulation protein
MEQEILRLLQQSPGRSFSLKEISKAIDRKQFREDPTWARTFLQRLLNAGVVRKDDGGGFFVPRE